MLVKRTYLSLVFYFPLFYLDLVNIKISIMMNFCAFKVKSDDLFFLILIACSFSILFFSIGSLLEIIYQQLAYFQRDRSQIVHLVQLLVNGVRQQDITVHFEPPHSFSSDKSGPTLKPVASDTWLIDASQSNDAHIYHRPLIIILHLPKISTRYRNNKPMIFVYLIHLLQIYKLENSFYLQGFIFLPLVRSDYILCFQVVKMVLCLEFRKELGKLVLFFDQYCLQFYNKHIKMSNLADNRYNKAINAFTYGFNCLVYDIEHNQLHDCIISIHQVYINILHAIISKKVSFLLKLHEIYNISDNQFSTESKLKQFGVHHYLILYTQSLQSFIFAFKTQYEKQIFKIGTVIFVREAKLYYDRLNQYNPFKAESMMTFLDADKDGGNLLDIEEIQSILSKMKIIKTREEILKDIEQIDKVLFQQEKLKRPKDMKNTQLNDLGFEYLLRFYTIKDDLLKYFCNFCNQYKPKVRSNKISIVDIVRYNDLPIMSASQLCQFFERIMFQNMTEEQGLQLIRSFPIYDEEGRQKKQKLEMISFNHFCSIISSRKNSAYVEEKKQLYQKMTNPITDYYISADFSHYSLQDDKGQVKINHFQLALKRGARCLHIHIQQTKQGQPYVSNSSSSSKTSLEEIFKIISTKGFQFNHFPILLMIQYGVMTKTGLDKVAQILNEVFEDQLYRVPPRFQQDQILPSPEQLKFKIIIMSNVNPKLFKAKQKDFPEESLAFFKSVSLFGTKLDFQRKGQFAWNFCVLDNEKIQKLEEVQDQNLSNYTKKLIVKTGPTPQKGEEINRPTSVYLRLGIQIIGLNFKKPNEENYLIQSLFMQNGGSKSGYLLKPLWMCLKNPKNLYAKNFQVVLFTLTIKLISGQNCIINNFQGQKVYAEIYLVGNRKEQSSNKKYTTAFQNPGYYIQFNLESETGDHHISSAMSANQVDSLGPSYTSTSSALRSASSLSDGLKLQRVNSQLSAHTHSEEGNWQESSQLPLEPQLILYYIYFMEWLIKPKQKAKYQGKYNFQLFISDESVDSSSTVSITAFTDRSQRAAVPCNYVWFLIKNGVPQEVPDFRGSSFICETSHIGFQLQAHIISNDPEYGGKAIVTFGPIELDVNLKTQILNALSQGYSNQAVFLIGSQQQQKQCTIQVYQEKIKIMHAFSDLQYIFDYSLLEPLFTHHPKEINHLTILFSEKYEQDLRRFERRLFNREQQSVTRSSIKQNMPLQVFQSKLQIRFLSRAQRDIFLYTIKGFIAKRQIKNSAVVRKLQKINFQSDEEFGAIIQINQLRRDLARYDRAYKRLVNDRKKLEQNLESSIYNSRHDNNYKVTSPNRKQQNISLKHMQIQRQNEALNKRILTLVQEINQLKQNATVIINQQQQRANFSKKKLPEENTITHLLDDLNRSDQMVHFDVENQFAIDRLQSEKRVLQMNLQQAHQKIAFLERNNKSGVQGQGIISVQKALFDRLRAQNEDLKRINDRIDRELKHSKGVVQQLKRQAMQRAQSSQLRTSDNQHLQREIDDLRSQLAICQRQLDEQTKAKENLQDKYINLSRKYSELQTQIQMYKKNQDVLNRSQALSEQMEDYNQEQIKILKEHNSFLVNENQKLAKACEKYMAEAKQAIKLRQEILQLKQKLNSAYTNPENNSFI